MEVKSLFSPVPAGASGKPSLLSPQGHIMTPGQKLTLQCHSEIAYDMFVLSKKWDLYLQQVPSNSTRAGFSQADFILDSVSIFVGGQYHCYGRHDFNTLWSEPSEPLEIRVAGEG